MQSQESMFEEPESTPAHPINTDPREQQSRQPTPPAEGSGEAYHEYSEGYNGEGHSEGYNNEGYSEGYHAPYAEPSLMEGEKLRPRQRPLPKKRSVARPLAVLLLIVALMIAWGGFSHTNFNGEGHPWPHHSHSHFDGAQGAAPASQSFLVTNSPTLVVNGGSGSIHVRVGNTNNVLVSTNDGAPVQTQQNGNTIDVGTTDSSNSLQDDGQDLNITVPAASDLEIHSTSGDIQVEGVNGQMTLSSDDGNVELEHTLLSGDTSIKTTDGDISVQGAIESQGSYQFQTDSGDVKLTLPENSSFHLTSSTDSGSVSNGFEGKQAKNSPGPQLNVSTDSGNITVQPQDGE